MGGSLPAATWILGNALAAELVSGFMYSGLRDFLMVAGWGGSAAAGIMTLGFIMDKWPTRSRDFDGSDRAFHDFSGTSPKLAVVACWAFVIVHHAQAARLIQLCLLLTTFVLVVVATISTPAMYREWSRAYYGD